jgi:hypothetical protein
LINLIILTACSSNVNSKDKDEVRRLASKNIKLRQELMTLKSECNQLKADNEGLEQTLELNRLTKEEQYNRISKEHMELINKANETDNFQQLIKLYAPFLIGEHEEKYGEIIYSRIQSDEIDKFISLLGKENIYKVDDITNSLVIYADKNGINNDLSKIIDEYEEHNQIGLESKEFYILLRLHRLIEQSKQ